MAVQPIRKSQIKGGGKMKKYLVAVILAVVSAFVFVAMTPDMGQAADRKVFKLRSVAGHPYAKGAYWVQSQEDFFCREVEKRVLERTSKYEVKFKGMYGGSLAKLGEVLESVQRGIADVGFVCPVFEMSKLEPFNFPFWIPFTSGDVPLILRTSIKTVNHFPLFRETLAKYNQRLIGDAYLTQTSYHLITTFPVKTMEDLKGKKIGHGGPMLPWLAALGATSVQATYNEVYTSIDTGVIDGYSMPANIVSGFKILEVAKYFTEVNFCGTMAGHLNINLKTWNKLPKEVQDIMIEVGNEYSWDVVKRCLAIEKNAYNAMISNGVSIYKLPEKERARWAKRLNDARVAAKAIADAKKNGFPADKIAAYYIKTMEGEGYKFPYPPILTLK